MVKVINLARDLIKLLGYEPEKDIKIEYTGLLRPGEKLYEELITEGEDIIPTTHKKIMVLQGEDKASDKTDELLSRLAKTATGHDARSIKDVLREIIPEYTPDFEALSIVQPLSKSLSRCNQTVRN